MRMSRLRNHSIIGQPWFFDHVAQFDYIPTTGIHIQIWEKGDRTASSVKISIPILNSPRNIFKGSAEKFTSSHGYTAASISLDGTPMKEENNPFALRYTTNDLSTVWTPAEPSHNA